MIATRSAVSAAAAMLAFVAAGCFQPSTVALQGTPGDIASLVGEWRGEYASAESRRSGSIMFTIVAGKDTAFGDVMMTPDMGEPVVAADARTGIHRAHASAPDVLRARFVAIDGNVVRGELEPYIAPDCQCVVTTVFRGVLQGDRIEGAYVTRGDGGLQREGRWYVARARR